MKQEGKVLFDAADELKAAIYNLEQFTILNEREAIPHVQSIKIINNRLVSTSLNTLEKTLDLIKAFFLPRWRQKQHLNRIEVQKTLMESIEFLKTHYRIIHKMKKGDETEQAYATWAQNTINRYNNLLIKAKISPQSLQEYVERYIYRKSGLSIDEEVKNIKIDIPHEFSVRCISSDSPWCELMATNRILSLLQHNKTASFKPTKQEEELFLMKSISMGKNALPPKLQKSLQEVMREAPIETFMKFTSPQHADAPGTAIISLEQTISSFPGERITAQGSFKRDATSTVPSVPIPNSFRISTDSIQTGFPHPSQSSGWALSHASLPDCPHRLDQMPLFEPYYEKKKKMALELLPAGSLNEKAKQLLKIKKEIFTKRANHYLHLHQTLIEAIVHAASPHFRNTDLAYQSIAPFFNYLEKQEDAFEMLCQTHHAMNQLFIDRPYETLYQEWLEKRNPQIRSKDPKVSRQACIDVLEAAIEKSALEIQSLIEAKPLEEEKKILTYLLLIGRVIGEANCALILQQMSEKMLFAPSPLNDFEQKIQACAFKQLIAFFADLDFSFQRDANLDIARIEQRFLELLHEEITLFLADSCDAIQGDATAITHELEFYYNSRYYSRL